LSIQEIEPEGTIKCAIGGTTEPYLQHQRRGEGRNLDTSSLGRFKRGGERLGSFLGEDDDGGMRYHNGKEGGGWGPGPGW